MLKRLFIKNFGLIDEAELLFEPGFTVFTGETGAGKSMLIDALSLAIGARGGVGFVKQGAVSAAIEATFNIAVTHPCHSVLADFGLDADDGDVILRRQVKADGKTRCFVNGISITQSQMAFIGDALVDIHGQRDQQVLLRPLYHAKLLDQFSGNEKIAEAVKSSHKIWYGFNNELSQLRARAEQRDKEIDLLNIYVEELSAIDANLGEEQELATERQRLMQSDKVMQTLSEAQSLLENNTPAAHLAKAERLLQNYGESLPEIASLLEELATAAATASDAENTLSSLVGTLEADPQRLEEVDERLHMLRQLARKHHVSCDALPDKLIELQQSLAQLTDLDSNMAELEQKTNTAWDSFASACAKLTAQRQKTAVTLAKKVGEVLVHLKMPDVVFKANLEQLPETQWGQEGAEKVAFYVQTNPGSPLAPLDKAASGGEVSRLMLALKAVFFANMAPQTLIFDEIDTGVGGAVADAVGLCLADLANSHQVFAITHLPQVAARGRAHLKIAKMSGQNMARTKVSPLYADDRRDEIARMLAGANITTAAKEAATSLLTGVTHG